ncbi:MAG TPA: thioredoxin domain-containing protein [Chitinophagaceae bacterium]|nr:thioredoxin domain-containing protein [Chitinophagaceae bacterium]
MAEFSNHLIHETSPYLLQHAHNPVEWYPWGEEALARARRENKPILVSIGYSACHWCHVMERESFEDPDTASLMNREFINIKIDREERPDLDHIYMDAVQAMTGAGGWPLNVFLTPEAKPFYGGTYFPPTRFHNRPSWQEVLTGVARSFREKGEAISQQAESLTDHLRQANQFGLQVPSGDASRELFSRASLDQVYGQIMQQADRQWGGFGRAPKFPQTMAILYLLRYHWLTGENGALEQAERSLQAMIRGGIYDQLGGGFARYATDTEWLVPHFEKMLYDNALLIQVLAEACQLTGRGEYRRVIQDTLAFVTRELMGSEPAFLSALDADSEGEEGKFYTWDYAEVESLLGADAGLFCAYYDISPQGNWEGRNILRVSTPRPEFAARHGLSETELESRLEQGRRLLMRTREGRVRPGTDDKVILGWNALMNSALTRAYQATGRDDYRELAVANMRFLLDQFRDPDHPGHLRHVWKTGASRYPAFLDDYAFLIRALIDLYEVTADAGWLQEAAGRMAWVREHFQEEGTGFFYYTHAGQEDVILRKKEIYDGAVPSGNAVMAVNLHHLGILLDRSDYREQAAGMLVSLGRVITQYPTSFGCWACLLQESVAGTREIAIVGDLYATRLAELLTHYVPHRVLMAAPASDPDYPLLAGKGEPGTTQMYLCKDFSCRQPVDSTSSFIQQLTP